MSALTKADIFLITVRRKYKIFMYIHKLIFTRQTVVAEKGRKAPQKVCNTMTTLASPAAPNINARRKKSTKSTVIRIRPSLKGQHTVVEPLSSSQVVLHPIPLPEEETVSSQLVRQNYATDTEYVADSVLGQDTTQDKLHSSIGMPMALKSMQSLFKQKSSKPQLLFVTGSRHSGKTYTAFGPLLSKQKQDTDGLVPRIMDSFFRQAQHQGPKGTHFAVELSLYLVPEAAKNNKEALVDLLNSNSCTPTKRGAIAKSIACATKNNSAVKSLAARFERIPKASQKKYDSVNEPVFLEQYNDGYHVINGQTRTCNSASEARETLAVAMKRAERIRSSGHHVVARLQPVLLGKQQQQSGSPIVVVDLHVSSAARSSADRGKELPSPGGGFQAVLKCVQALKTEKLPYSHHLLTMLLQSTLQAHPRVTILLTVAPDHENYGDKKMLFEQVCSTMQVAVTTGLTASPGLVVASPPVPRPTKKRHKVHAAEKTPEPAKSITSAVEVQVESKPIKVEVIRKKKRDSEMKHYLESEDADDERSEKDPLEKCEIVRNPSMTYSDSTNEDDDGFLHDEYFVPVPPPPTARDISTRHLPRYVESPGASAPVDEVAPNLRSTPRVANILDILDAPPPTFSAVDDETVEDRIQELEKENTKLRRENERIKVLETENAKLREENTRTKERNKQLEEELCSQREAPNLVENSISIHVAKTAPLSIPRKPESAKAAPCVPMKPSSNPLGKLSELVKARNESAQDNPWETRKAKLGASIFVSPAAQQPKSSQKTENVNLPPEFERLRGL